MRDLGQGASAGALPCRFQPAETDREHGGRRDGEAHSFGTWPESQNDRFTFYRLPPSPKRQQPPISALRHSQDRSRHGILCSMPTV